MLRLLSKSKLMEKFINLNRYNMYLFKYTYDYGDRILTRKDIYAEDENGNYRLVSEGNTLDPSKLIDIDYEEI